MARKTASRQVKTAFEGAAVQLAIADIQPLQLVSAAVKKTSEIRPDRQLDSARSALSNRRSLRAIATTPANICCSTGICASRCSRTGETEVVCLISTDDEAFTYNKRVNRLAIIQEHRMILKAIERGVPEERIAKALNIDVETHRNVSGDLLDGICPEAAELLKDKHVAIHTFAEFKKMTPLRQIEAAELMVAMNKYTISYARSLLAATPQDSTCSNSRSQSASKAYATSRWR